MSTNMEPTGNSSCGTQETDFKNAKVGDRVWHTGRGEGKIIRMNQAYGYPIRVEFHCATEISFTHEGVAFSDGFRTLFWDEIQITPPPRPKRKVVRSVKRWMVVRPSAAYKDGVAVEICFTRELAENQVEIRGGTISGPYTFECEVEE